MSKRIVEKGTGRELSENLNYTGMEKGVRVLALRDKLAFAEEIAVMSELDAAICFLNIMKWFFQKVRMLVL